MKLPLYIRRTFPLANFKVLVKPTTNFLRSFGHTDARKPISLLLQVTKENFPVNPIINLLIDIKIKD